MYAPTAEAAAAPSASAALTSGDLAAGLPKAMHLPGFSDPGAVVYDPDQDVYFVSNVNGTPLAQDHNGFISRIDPKLDEIELKWIDGRQARTSMNAPKGMALRRGNLFVADIEFVRVFDARNGEPRGKLFVLGAVSLDDLAFDAEGMLYVTDTGRRQIAGGPRVTGAIHRIDLARYKPVEFRRDPALAGHCGIANVGDALWVVDAVGELYKLGASGGKESVMSLPHGPLDAIVGLEDGRALIVGREAATVYLGAPGGAFEPVVTGIESPASLGFDARRSWVLVPIMSKEKVFITSLPDGEPLPQLVPEDTGPAGVIAGSEPAQPAAQTQ